MIKIECDSAHDLSSFMQDTIDAKVEARLKSDLLYKEQDKCYTLRDEIAALKNENARLKLGAPPAKVEERSLRELIAAVKSGQKINAIKVIREMTGLGLKEAKDLFEAGYDGLKVA